MDVVHLCSLQRSFHAVITTFLNIFWLELIIFSIACYVKCAFQSVNIQQIYNFLNMDAAYATRLLTEDLHSDPGTRREGTQRISRFSS